MRTRGYGLFHFISIVSFLSNSCMSYVLDTRVGACLGGLFSSGIWFMDWESIIVSLIALYVYPSTQSRRHGYDLRHGPVKRGLNRRREKCA